MLENSLSKDFADVVNNAEGFALRIAHRFIIGVADMIVKMPGFPAAFLEAKSDHLPVKLRFVTLALSPLQFRFLKSGFAAGMTANGVISFCQRDKDFGISILSITRFDKPVIAVPVGEYRRAKLADRKPVMLEALVEYLKQESKVR